MCIASLSAAELAAAGAGGPDAEVASSTARVALEDMTGRAVGVDRGVPAEQTTDSVAAAAGRNTGSLKVIDQNWR